MYFYFYYYNFYLQWSILCSKDGTYIIKSTLNLLHLSGNWLISFEKCFINTIVIQLLISKEKYDLISFKTRRNREK